MTENVVLLDEHGHGIGTAAKSEVHHATTPLHLAFSCYVFDADDRLLLTQRAASKATFPGLWTNTVCGHPAPGEDIETAVRRRAMDELGLGLADLRLVLPDFRYTATMHGIQENEMCPVLVARPAGEIAPNPDEVGDVRWQPWEQFRSQVLDGTLEVSTWCRLQVAALSGLGPDPASWRTGDAHLLPPAARAA
ncbi:isopentenyl-diphosphate Delta-isomerase [Aeromicrobium wangtongii]|uniref:Isopentenyl-diphosphate Delta-isomerase n=1 Tax=Aeromicrobium wangtongii TaxID=2969247 RepID=A0ABY5M9V0_9ACTN|nr:isopentenyl-diphosphate Delta-isomerase [Aeromicrobium wangtongii]MCD9196712.1 isopentenyl-diphosphate Delta-isomerase [Aeromicrobium wangtongii]UUP14222.1 isopentenyl-diphosphate Delta-isomerase [Aeromicrobium wangtongii]